MLPLRTARTTLLTLFVGSALASQACGDERFGATADPDAGDRADSDAGGGDGVCDRFCVWDRFMEQALSTVYAECICSLSSPAETPIQEGRAGICQDSYTQSEQIEYERDCVAAMTETQLAELQTAVDCFDANIRGLLPCLDALEAGDVCGSCEPLDQPEGMPGRCPVSFETNTMIMNCTDGRPGF